MRNSAFTAVILAALLGGITPAYAEKFTAGHVLEKMNQSDRYSFVAGMVEGFAYARFLADGKKEKGMICIHDWFYKNNKAWPQIRQVFTRFKQHPPGVVLYVLIKKKCGA